MLFELRCALFEHCEGDIGRHVTGARPTHPIGHGEQREFGQAQQSIFIVLARPWMGRTYRLDYPHTASPVGRPAYTFRGSFVIPISLRKPR